MSIYIGLPGITIADASVEVYPDRIEIGTAERSTGRLSIHLSREQMLPLGEALIETARASWGESRQREVYPSSHDACTDAVADVIRTALEDELPDAHEDSWIYLAADVMKAVDRHMLLHQPGTFDQEVLSL